LITYGAMQGIGCGNADLPIAPEVSMKSFRISLLTVALAVAPGHACAETPADGMDHFPMGHAMQGVSGPYSMTREASRISCQPESSPHEGIMATPDGWMTMIHGSANLIYDHQGGPRGDAKTFSSSMLMMMGQRPLGEGTLGLRGMVSADPLMGKDGYPLLLQNRRDGRRSYAAHQPAASA
jgi:hypothetical protein